jgi:hypothetical protein
VFYPLSLDRCCQLVSSLYNHGADQTVNTTSSNPSNVVIGGCLAIDWISFLWKRVYRLLLRNRCLYAYCIAVPLLDPFEVSAQQWVFWGLCLWHLCLVSPSSLWLSFSQCLLSNHSCCSLCKASCPKWLPDRMPVGPSSSSIWCTQKFWEWSVTSHSFLHLQDFAIWNILYCEIGPWFCRYISAFEHVNIRILY